VTGEEKENLEIFCRQVEHRSGENFMAFHMLYQAKLYGNILSIIGQEIDSMIRVVYLLSVVDLGYRNSLIRASVSGERWTHNGTTKIITDRQMVDVATKLEFWVREAYKVRNGFIHLSNFHDYRHRDPLTLIPKQDKREILKHLRRWHNCPKQGDPDFEDIVPCLPNVISKMRSHLSDYIRKLRNQQVIHIR
jgi:hypothetical protein